MIKIVDNRIDNNVPVAAENIQFQELVLVPQTYQTLDNDGNVVEQTINVIQPTPVTTLKDTDADIENLSTQLAAARQNVSDLDTKLGAKVAMRDEANTTVQAAVSTMTIGKGTEGMSDVSEEVQA